jgi:hypothetical protein
METEHRPMRALTLVAAATLPLAACGEREDQQVAGNPEETAAAAANITTNDTTAIDAATGDAANMAADVNYIINAAENGADNGTGNVSDTAAANAGDE